MSYGVGEGGGCRRMYASKLAFLPFSSPLCLSVSLSLFSYYAYMYTDATGEQYRIHEDHCRSVCSNSSSSGGGDDDDDDERADERRTGVEEAYGRK